MDINNNPEQVPSIQPAPVAQGLKSFGVLWSETWQLYKKKFWLLVGIVAIPIATVLVAALVGGMFSVLLVKSGNSGAGAIVFVAIMLVAMIAALLISFWAQAALLFGVSEEAITFKEAFRKGQPIIGALLWVGILTGLILLFGFAAFIVPAVILWPWLLLSTFVVALEGGRGIDALRKSREYVRGMWWAVFWRMAVFTIIVIAVAAVLGFIPLINILIGLIVGPFSIAFSYVLYRNIKEVRGEVQPQSSRKLFIALAILGIVAVPILFVELFLIALSGQRYAGPENGFSENLNPEQQQQLQQMLDQLRASSTSQSTSTMPEVGTTSAQ